MDEPGAVHFGVVGADAPVTEGFRCRAVRLYDVGQQRQQGFFVVARRSTQVQHQTAAAIQHGPVGFHEGFQRFGVVHAAGVQQQCAAGQLPQRRGGVGVHRIPGQLQHFLGAVGVAHGNVPGQLQVAVPLLPLRLVSGQQGVGQVLHDALRRGAVDGQHFVTWAQARFLRHSIHEHARSAPAHRKATGEGHIALGDQFKFQVAVPHSGAVLAHGLQHQQRGHPPVVVGLAQHGDKGRGVVPRLFCLPTGIIVAHGQEKILQQLVALHIQPSSADVVVSRKSGCCAVVCTAAACSIYSNRKIRRCPRRTDQPDGRG